MSKYETNFFEYLSSLKRLQSVSPLFLGGVAGSGGGVGTRPGGYIGYLPQTQVTYDLSEDESLDIPLSGASLLDNLNHIRYRVANVESLATGGLNIYHDNVIVASGVTILDLDDNMSVIQTEYNRVKVDVTISGNIIIASGGTTFLDLLDTPSSYNTKGGNLLRVNSLETVVEFFEDDFVTTDEMINTLTSGLATKANLSHTHDDRYYTETEVDALVDNLATTFVELDDVPTSYAGSAGKAVIVNGTETGLLFTTISGLVGGVNFFTDLADVPSSYAGEANKVVAVKSTEDGLEFVTQSGGGSFSLTVKEIDSVPTVNDVTTIRVSNGTLVNDGGGQVTITISGGGSSSGVTDILMVQVFS